MLLTGTATFWRLCARFTMSKTCLLEKHLSAHPHACLQRPSGTTFTSHNYHRAAPPTFQFLAVSEVRDTSHPDVPPILYVTHQRSLLLHEEASSLINGRRASLLMAALYSFVVLEHEQQQQ